MSECLIKERRAERRRRRRLALERWWRAWVANGPEIGSWRLLTAAPTRDLPPSVELAQVLDEAAHRVAELGTGSERRLLEAMAEVAAESAPGAAAALVDAEGSEASRLRAFGVVHTHLLDALGRARARLAPRPPRRPSRPRESRPRGLMRGLVRGCPA